MNGKTTKLPKKYGKLTITEALDTAKQRLTALAVELRYTRDMEVGRINRMLEGNKMWTDPPRGETEMDWKGIRDKEASHNTNAQWLADLKEDHSYL